MNRPLRPWPPFALQTGEDSNRAVGQPSRAQLEAARSPLLTEAEAIAYLRLDTIKIDDPAATLRRYRERGLLRGTQVSKKVFYLRDELDRFLEKLTDENPR
jgi:hypothetical protein